MVHHSGIMGSAQSPSPSRVPPRSGDASPVDGAQPDSPLSVPWHKRLHIRRLIGPALIRAIVLLAPSRSIRGVRVASIDLTQDAAEIFNGMHEALGLIETTDPRWMRRLRRYTWGILVMPVSNFTVQPGRTICVPGTAPVTDPIFTAGALVHETMHLCIARRGIKYREPLLRRIETACIRREAEFLRGIEEVGDRYADEALADLEKPSWDAKSTREAYRRDVETAPLPEWMRRKLLGKRGE